MAIGKYPPNFGEEAYVERARNAAPSGSPRGPDVDNASEMKMREEKLIAGQKAQKAVSLNGIILDRREMHYSRVHDAFARLTEALCEAEEDGFQFFMYSNAPQPAGVGNTVAEARIPRLYDVEVVSRYSAPI